MIFDSKLSFIPHIKDLKFKCLKSLNLLKVVPRFDWDADRTVLLRLYRSLIRSKLDYGSIVYGSARESYIQILDTVHNQEIKISTGALRTSHVKSLYVESNEESLYRRRERLPLKYALKYANTFANRPNDIPTCGIRVKHLIDEANIDINRITPSVITHSDVSTWL